MARAAGLGAVITHPDTSVDEVPQEEPGGSPSMARGR